MEAPFVIGVAWISVLYRCRMDVSLNDRCPMDISLVLGIQWISIIIGVVWIFLPKQMSYGSFLIGVPRISLLR